MQLAKQPTNLKEKSKQYFSYPYLHTVTNCGQAFPSKNIIASNNVILHFVLTLQTNTEKIPTKI